jgi:hypothetical protein
MKTYLKKPLTSVTTLLLVFLIAHTAVSGHFFKEFVSPLVERSGDYQLLRNSIVARGIDVPDLAQKLSSALLPADISALRSLGANGIEYQRIKEGLYPRGASNLTQNYALDSPPPESFNWPFGTLLLSLASLVGLAAIPFVVFRFGPSESISTLAGILGLCGAATLGVIFSIGTWLQLPVGNETTITLSCIGWLLLFRTSLLKRHLKPKLHFDITLGLFIFVSFLVRMATLPIEGWDGRSIWFFRAKELHFQKMLSFLDATNPRYQFSHPEYPLLFSSWLAHFTAFEPPYNERAAALSLPLLYASVILPLWALLKRRFGPWVGGSLILSGFVGTRFLDWGGYTDGFLMFTVGLTYIGLSSDREEDQKLGWLAALVASLTKFEGFLFAAWIVAVLSFRNDKLRSRRPWFIFLFPIAQLLRNKILRLGSDFSHIHWIENLVTIPSRSWTILNGIWAMLGGSGPMQSALFFLLVSLFLILKNKSLRTEEATRLGTIILGMLAMLALIYEITPLPLANYLAGSLDRTSLHVSFLILFLPFVLLISPETKFPRQ